MINQYQQLGNYLFVSTDNNGKIGSVYYENGRIRLVHSKGPTISGHDCIAYFVVPNYFRKPDKKDYYNKKFKDIYELVVTNNKGLLLEQTNNVLTKGRSYTTHSIGSISNISSRRLYEVYFKKTTNNGLISNGSHPSRGYPQKIIIDNTVMINVFNEIRNFVNQTILDKNKIVYDQFFNSTIMPQNLIHPPNNP